MDFFTKLAPREKVIFLAMVIFGIIAAYVFLAIKPKLDDKAEILKEQQGIAKEIETAENALSDARQVKANAADTQARLNRLRQALPEKSHVPALLVDLPQLVGEEDVTLNEFSPEPAVSVSGVTKQPIKIAVSGDFFNILEFVYDIQNFPRYMQVNNLLLTTTAEEAAPGTAATGPTVVKASIEVSTYYTDPPPAEAAAAAN